MQPTFATRPQHPRAAAGRRHRPTGRSRGFTLIELLVSTVIITAVLTGVLTLFTMNSRLARVQLHLSEMQQSLRIGQYEMVRSVRMAGRGGLPMSQYPAGAFGGRLLPDGIAVAVDNNVAAGTRLGACDCARVLEGTDVLTVRGVFNSPIYQVNPASGDFQLGAPGEGTLILRNVSPTGVPQSLEAIREAIVDTQGGNPEALLLVSPLADDLYAIVEMDASSSFNPPSGTVETATINFKYQGGTNTAEYLDLSPGGVYPAGLNTVSFAGVLEEYRFYIRETHAIPGDVNSELIPRLARARLYPGTEAKYLDDDGNLSADLADNILDLQVALGIDTDLDEDVEEDSPPTIDDEWLFNATADDPDDTAKWNRTVDDQTRLYYVRINSLARTDRPDPRFQAPLLTTIEDKDYNSAPFDKYNEPEERRYRRRLLQTTIDLRNLS